MNEMSRKRKLCCGLSSCCVKPRTESASKMISESSKMSSQDMKPKTCGQKCGSCCCWPFRKMSNPFKRRKVADNMGMSPMTNAKPSIWQRMCCCSSCCRRCRKVEDKEMDKVIIMLSFFLLYLRVGKRIERKWIMENEMESACL